MAERTPLPLLEKPGGAPPPQAARRRAEAEAEAAGRLGSAAPRLGPAPEGTRAARLSGFGRPLPEGFRRIEEARLGADLSRVRLHDDAAAQEALDATGARALAQGQDVAMTPADARAASPEALGLMRHEVAHTVQQSTPGAATLTQREDRDADRGIGRRPPDANVVDMDTPGSEDDHALFEQDSATLTAAGRATLAALAEGRSGEVVAMIHGYASLEGADDYNRNLSAHRAVAARDALGPLLPAGTRFVLYAHGETDAFGEAPSNRRVGVDLITPDDGSYLSGPGPLSLFPRRPGISLFGPGELQLQPPGSAPPRIPHPAGVTPEALGIDLELPVPVPDPGPLLGPRVQTVDERIWAPPPSLFDTDYDWSGSARDAARRGVGFSDGDHVAIDGHFSYWRLRFFQLGLPPDLATDAAQFGTDIMVGTHLSLQHPDRFELFDRKWGTEPPPTITILNETRMMWIFERFRNMTGD